MAIQKVLKIYGQYLAEAEPWGFVNKTEVQFTVVVWHGSLVLCLVPFPD